MMENQNANTTRTSNEGNSRPSNTTNQIPKPSCISGERAVSFSSIEIREFPLCMGDNPGCLRGVSVMKKMLAIEMEASILILPLVYRFQLR